MPRDATVMSVIERHLGLRLNRTRLEVLMGWLQRRGETLALRPAELLHQVFGAGFEDELASMIALVTNQETSFFRGERQLSLFDSEVVQPILEGDVARPIRMWSAACSTGEEALTLGMLVGDRLSDGSQPGVDHPPVEIVGSDLCSHTVRRAAAMRYSLDSETRLGPDRSDRYFTVDGSALIAKTSALPPIRFRAHNLIHPGPFGTFDVIVARNVFFYMTARARDVAVRNLLDVLRPGGTVVFGTSDGIANPAGLEPIGAHCYRRKSER